MLLKEAISNYKNKFPGSSMTDEQIADYICTLDSMVQTEVFHTFPKTVADGEIVDGALVAYSIPDDNDTALQLTGTPFEDLYGLYVSTMAFYDSQDWMKYSNAKGMFNARYADLMAYQSRNNVPATTNYVKNIW